MQEATTQAHEDQQLIQDAQHDAQAFAGLYHKYVDRIYQFIYYRVGNNTETAQDLTQEVFTRAFKLIDQFEWQGYPYSAYLYTVARSVCQDHYKQRVVEDIDEYIGIKDGKVVSAEMTTDIQLLWKEIGMMSKEVQEILELRYLEDLSYDEIGKIVGKKPGAVRTMVSRTIDKLQQQYAEQ